MDTNNSAKGGSELMMQELKKRLPEVEKKFSIFNYPVQADTNKKLVYWNQLSYDQPTVQFLSKEENLDQIKNIVFVSNWQSEKFREKFKIPGFKSKVIKNACIESFPKKFTKKNKVKICYTSTPWRGLDVLLLAWEKFNTEDCELHIFSSTKIYGDEYAKLEDANYQLLYEKAQSLKGVVYRGFVENEELRKELPEFDILAYPSTFEETSCIAVIEALSTGLRVVCSNIGALPETTEGWARMYEYRIDKSLHAELFGKILREEVDKIKTGELIPDLKEQVKIYAKRWSWEERIKEWKEYFKNIDNESSTNSSE